MVRQEFVDRRLSQERRKAEPSEKDVTSGTGCMKEFV